MTIAEAKIFVDTDVLIDFLRGYPAAVAFLTSHRAKLAISVITLAELYAGVRDETEKEGLDAFLKAFTIVDITQDIASLGATYRRQYGRSHGMGLADALIAATAHSHGATLATLNHKHFSMFETTVVPYRKL